jgi:hypothetical protein
VVCSAAMMVDTFIFIHGIVGQADDLFQGKPIDTRRRNERLRF